MSLLGGGKPCYSHTSPWLPLSKAGDPIPREISSVLDSWPEQQVLCSAGAAVTQFSRLPDFT